ncbi:MAG: threonine 3-dehydrogenase [Saprospiraceae bacterium]|jgi:threonine 3-dehydrogenase
MKKDVILVTGANGQIGSVLTEKLRSIYGHGMVLATDIREFGEMNGPFEILDILDKARLYALINKYKVTQIYHLAAILSATGELKPTLAWQINMDGLFNVLEAARELNISKVFYPSSIAVFGKQTPRQNTPQYTILHPSSVYGISKAAGENWCQYYFEKYKIDIRSIRYPGIISYQSDPGGGTTDYAVEVFHYAIKGLTYKCFLKADTRLPMIYMDDAIRATMELMDAPAENISVRTSYNLASMSFTPEEISNAIKQIIPDFQISYEPDFRQAIAESWAESVDDAYAQKDWAWKPAFNLEDMTKDMVINLKKKEREAVKIED